MTCVFVTADALAVFEQRRLWTLLDKNNVMVCKLIAGYIFYTRVLFSKILLMALLWLFCKTKQFLSIKSCVGRDCYCFNLCCLCYNELHFIVWYSKLRELFKDFFDANNKIQTEALKWYLYCWRLLGSPEDRWRLFWCMSGDQTSWDSYNLFHSAVSFKLYQLNLCWPVLRVAWKYVDSSVYTSGSRVKFLFK
jgi:hypothetical protein